MINSNFGLSGFRAYLEFDDWPAKGNLSRPAEPTSQYALAHQADDNFLCGKRCRKRKAEKRKLRAEKKRLKNDARRAEIERVRAETKILSVDATPVGEAEPVVLNQSRPKPKVTSSEVLNRLTTTPTKAGNKQNSILLIGGLVLIGAVVIIRRRK